jgi:phosphoadenosine phosphosulfate reductase
MDFGRFNSFLRAYLDKEQAIFVSSSFQTHSIPLLHMISRVDRSIPVVFLNTGFLFPETLGFRDQVIDFLGLTLLDLQSAIPKSLQRDPEGRFFYSSDPDRCCSMNKVQPMEAVLWEYDVWINGVRKDQSAVRKAFTVEQPTPQRAVRFHPMLDWTSRDIYNYRMEFALPEHPLDKMGYVSIGCAPCTQKIDLSDVDAARKGRWFGQMKTECGLHTALVENKQEK